MITASVTVINTEFPFFPSVLFTQEPKVRNLWMFWETRTTDEQRLFIFVSDENPLSHQHPCLHSYLQTALRLGKDCKLLFSDVKRVNRLFLPIGSPPPFVIYFLPKYSVHFSDSQCIAKVSYPFHWLWNISVCKVWCTLILPFFLSRLPRYVHSKSEDETVLSIEVDNILVVSYILSCLPLTTLL